MAKMTFAVRAPVFSLTLLPGFSKVTMLERDGLIRRTALMDGNVRVVEYSSTSWGRDVMSIVMQIHHWSLSHRGKLRGASRDRRQPPCQPLENGH